MNTRTFVVIWLTAISLFVVVIAGVIFYPVTDSEDTIDIAETPIPQAPVIVIGSSLMRSAVPGLSSENGKGLLEDYRSHARLAINSIREEQSLRLLERVLDQNVEVVFLEANPFAFDFATEITEKQSDSILLSFVIQLKKNSRFLAKKINTLLQRSPPEPLTSKAKNLDKEFNPRKRDVKMYPLYLRSPSNINKLRRLINKAKAQKVRVILIAPPRSQWSAQYIGEKGAKELELHLQNLARQLDLPLFQTNTFWPNENFWDSAHMNAKGRKRFLEKLAIWWKKYQWPPKYFY